MAKLPNSAGERTDGEWLSPSQNAGLAQLVEYLFCTQDVAGSNPVSGSTASLWTCTRRCGLPLLICVFLFDIGGSSACGAAVTYMRIAKKFFNYPKFCLT